MAHRHDDGSPAKPKTRAVRSSGVRAAWLALGWGALTLGAAGVVLPLLPTTPFVLLAAFAFGRGSPRLRKWLVTHRHFGPVIRDWEAHGAIRLRYKVLACSLMLLAFMASLLAGLSALVLSIQVICMGGAALYVLTRPTGSRANLETGPRDGNPD